MLTRSWLIVRKSKTVSMALNLTLSDAVITPMPGRQQPVVTSWRSYVMSILETQTQDQNAIIKVNRNVGPEDLSSGSRYSDPLIRKNITIPASVKASRTTEWSNTAWSLIGDQLEAWRILAPWLQRSRLFDEIQKDSSLGFSDFRKKHGYEYLDHQLWSNVKRMKSSPELPNVGSARIVYSKMGTQCSGSPWYDRKTGVLHWDNVNIGRAWLSFTWHAPWIRARYPRRALQTGRISRGTIQSVPKISHSFGITYDEDVNGKIRAGISRTSNTVSFDPATDDVRFTFTVKSTLPSIRKRMRSVVGFDIGMESHAVMAGRRVSLNGSASGPLTLSHEGSSLQRHVLVLQEKERAVLAKLSRIRQDHEPAANQRIVDSAVHLHEKLEALKDAMDWAAADSIVKHCRPGDVLAAEELSWSGGGPVKFRHGRQQARVEHLAARRGVKVLKVNPARTSHECPACHAAYDANHRTHSFTCDACGYTGDKDDAAGYIIALRGLGKLHKNNRFGLSTVLQTVRSHRPRGDGHTPARNQGRRERGCSIAAAGPTKNNGF
jgi:ribosomal protein L37AE/L43A